ncbi:MAG: hypothetical protein ACW98J_07670 [Candidatus Thorarchaeota archaeon]|jgi:hypothetical protein
MVEFSFTFIRIPLQQNAEGTISLILGINLLLLVILIVVFLGVTWNRNNSQLGAIRTSKIVLGLYIVFLVINALIYIGGILQGSMPYISGGPIILNNPVLFFIFLSPPIPLMYLDIRLPESSGFFASLSNSALVLLVWLVVIVIASGFSYGFLFLVDLVLLSSPILRV